MKLSGLPLPRTMYEPRPHAAGNNSHVALTRTYRSLTSDQHVLAVVVLPGHIVVMAAHDFHIGFERRDFSRALDLILPDLVMKR